MGKVKKFKKIKRLKWHTQKEKRQKLEEIKEELITRLKRLRLRYVRKPEKAIYTIEPTGTRESFIIEEKFYWITLQRQRLNLIEQPIPLIFQFFFLDLSICLFRFAVLSMH